MKLKVFLVVETAKIVFLSASVKGNNVPVPAIVDAKVHGVYDNIEAARLRRKRLVKKEKKELKDFDVFPLEVSGPYVNDLKVWSKKLGNENVELLAENIALQEELKKKEPKYYIQDENNKNKFIGVAGRVTIPSQGIGLVKIDPIAYQDDQEGKWSDDVLGFNHAD